MCSVTEGIIYIIGYVNVCHGTWPGALWRFKQEHESMCRTLLVIKVLFAKIQVLIRQTESIFQTQNINLFANIMSFFNWLLQPVVSV